ALLPRQVGWCVKTPVGPCGFRTLPGLRRFRAALLPYRPDQLHLEFMIAIVLVRSPLRDLDQPRFMDSESVEEAGDGLVAAPRHRRVAVAVERGANVGDGFGLGVLDGDV